MKITYIKLINVAGISVGSNKNKIEIFLNNTKNKVVSIQGDNGVGKTVLLSSLSPFANVSSLDNRSTLSYIKHKCDGYKEIHYTDGKNEYIIKHKYKASKDSHIVKSYIQKNGIELNENGNVTSFNDLVEIHMGLTQDILRLSRLGTNVNSFITLSPAKRKEYIGKLINEIDMYLTIYRKINDDIKVIKSLMSANSNNIHACNITDISEEQEKLKTIKDNIAIKNKTRDELIAKVTLSKKIMSSNSIADLRIKQSKLMSSINDFDSLLKDMSDAGISNVSISELLDKRNELNQEITNINSEIKANSIRVDDMYYSIENIRRTIKSISVNDDMSVVVSRINDLNNEIKSTSPEVINFDISESSEKLSELINMLRGHNQTAMMIYTLDSNAITKYVQLKNEQKSIDKFITKQTQLNMNDGDYKSFSKLLNTAFESNEILYPNCLNEFENCPYFKINKIIDDLKVIGVEESFDNECLRYIKVISHNIDIILNQLDIAQSLRIPKFHKSQFSEHQILTKLSNKMQLFDINIFQEYLAITKAKEMYLNRISKLMEYESQVKIYKSIGIDKYENEINVHLSNIEKSKKLISDSNELLDVARDKIETIESHIAMISRYNDTKQFIDIMKNELVSVNNEIVPLENAMVEIQSLESNLSLISIHIDSLNITLRALENSINDYFKYMKESNRLLKIFNDLSMILNATSTKKGIPVVYMKTYLGKIQSTCNDLLKIIYNDELMIDEFNVTHDSFEIPYKKNGSIIPDVKYASQSEVALMTMALSFAISTKASDHYNILLLDEIDSGLDEYNRSCFLEMLESQMRSIHSEQVFIISHNIGSMINIPMDIIKLSDTIPISGMHNVIYE